MSKNSIIKLDQGEVKKLCSNPEILRVKATRYVRVQEQILIPTNLSVFSYSKLKLSVCTLPQES